MSGIEQETGVAEDGEIEQVDQEGQEQAEEVELEEISIAGAEAPAANEVEQDSTAIRQVREAHREEQRKRKELERKLAEAEAKAKPAEEPAPVVGAKPKMDDADIDFDSDKYEAALEKWREQKSARAAFEAKQRSTKEEQEKAHQQVLATYRQNADALPVDKAKFKLAESEVVSTFDVMQQNILLKSKVPERLVYAIGSNPAKLEELAKIKDPIALAYELGRTEKALTSTKQSKSAPPPDRPLTGGGSGTTAALERLEAEAEKTGDRSKLVAYKRQLKAKAA